MAGINNITNKIQSDAEQRASRIKDEAEREAAEFTEQEKVKIDLEVEGILSDAQREAAETRNRMKSMSELEFRKELLTVKQQAIEEVFNITLDKIRKLPSEQYYRMLIKMICMTAITGKEKIILPEADKKQLPSNFLKMVQQGLKTRGLSGEVEISAENRPIVSGFILISDYTELNYTFEAILRMNRDEYEAEAIEGLFGNTETGA